jgi:hypothetical protein
MNKSYLNYGPRIVFLYPSFFFRISSDHLLSPAVCGRREDIHFTVFGSVWIICVNVKFVVFTLVTTKNGIFWDVMPCGCCKNCISEELVASIIRVERISWLQLLVTVNIPILLILSTLKIEAIRSSETSVLTRATRHPSQKMEFLICVDDSSV